MMNMVTFGLKVWCVVSSLITIGANEVLSNQFTSLRSRKLGVTNSIVKTRKLGVNNSTVVPFVSFFFWGDWGNNIHPVAGKPSVQETIANQIGKFATNIKPSFMCILGDNFYQQGVNSTTDPLWDSYYRRVYTAPATFVPWYPIFGNHDYYPPHGKPQAQIDYWKQRIDTRWVFPDYQYSVKWRIPGTNKTFQIVFINTVTLCPEVRASQIGWPSSPSALKPIWQPVQKWIASILSSSTADYLLVAGHYNVYSNSQDNNGIGGTEYNCMRYRLVPLMQKYGVVAYLNGHMHNFQHHFLDGINYITAGHGANLGTNVRPGSPVGLRFNKNVGGFGGMSIGPANISLYFIDQNGNYIYNATILNPPHRRQMAALAADK